LELTVRFLRLNAKR